MLHFYHSSNVDYVHFVQGNTFPYLDFQLVNPDDITKPVNLSGANIFFRKRRKGDCNQLVEEIKCQLLPNSNYPNDDKQLGTDGRIRVRFTNESFKENGYYVSEIYIELDSRSSYTIYDVFNIFVRKKV